MEKILADLKQTREEVEERFDALIEGLEEAQERLQEATSSMREQAKALGTKAAKGLREVYDSAVWLHEHCTDTNHKLILGLMESKALFNARSAELARQLTVLPLERMDLILDKFERRLEDQEVKFQRLERELRGAVRSRSD